MGDEHHEDGATTSDEAHQPSFPISRVKKIMKLDKDINKINAEAAFLITCSAELFLQFLAERSAQVVLEKKKKTIKLDHLHVAVKQHQPTSDFLLDSLPKPSQPAELPHKDHKGSRISKEPISSGSKRIEAFFHKCT